MTLPGSLFADVPKPICLLTFRRVAAYVTVAAIVGLLMDGATSQAEGGRVFRAEVTSTWVR